MNETVEASMCVSCALCLRLHVPADPLAFDPVCQACNGAAGPHPPISGEKLET